MPTPLNPARGCFFSFILVHLLRSQLSSAGWSLALNPVMQPNRASSSPGSGLGSTPESHFCFLFWDPGTPPYHRIHLGRVVFWPSGPLAKSQCLLPLIRHTEIPLLICCPLPRLPLLHNVLFSGISAFTTLLFQFGLKLFQVQLWENRLSISTSINLSLKRLSAIYLTYLN